MSDTLEMDAPDLPMGQEYTEQPKEGERVIGAEIDGPGKQFFENVVLDNLHDAILELSAAVWTFRDRSIILEQVLSDVLKESGHEVDLAAKIEAYRPSPEVQQQRAAERSELVANVFRSFMRKSQ